MSNKKIELYAEKKNVFAQMQDLNKRASNEKRSFSADEKDQWDALNTRMDEVSADIARETQWEERLKEQQAENFQANENSPIKASKEARVSAYKKMLRYGFKQLTKNEQALVEHRGTSTQITTTDGIGGYLVPEGFGNEIVKTMSYHGGMLEAGKVIRTASGNSMPFPTSDQTAVKGRRIGEGIAQNVLDINYLTKNLDAYVYTSDIIKWSYPLIQDSAFDIASETNFEAAARLGRILNEEFTTGTGSSQPNGVVTAAGTGKVAAATDAITSSELLDLIYSVDYEYRRNSAFMLSDNVVKAIRQLEIGSGDSRPLWQPSMRDDEPETIHGYKYFINNDMDNLTSGVNSTVALFGDFQKYYIRLSKDFTLKRLDERYADEMVVAFFMFCRADAELMDTAAIKGLDLAAS